MTQACVHSPSLLQPQFTLPTHLLWAASRARLWAGAPADFPCLRWPSSLHPCRVSQHRLGLPTPPPRHLHPPRITFSFLGSLVLLCPSFSLCPGPRVKVHSVLLREAESRGLGGTRHNRDNSHHAPCLSEGPAGVGTLDASHLMLSVCLAGERYNCHPHSMAAPRLRQFACKQIGTGAVLQKSGLPSLSHHQ